MSGTATHDEPNGFVCSIHVWDAKLSEKECYRCLWNRTNDRYFKYTLTALDNALLFWVWWLFHLLLKTIFRQWKTHHICSSLYPFSYICGERLHSEPYCHGTAQIRWNEQPQQQQYQTKIHRSNERTNERTKTILTHFHILFSFSCSVSFRPAPWNKAAAVKPNKKKETLINKNEDVWKLCGRAKNLLHVWVCAFCGYFWKSLNDFSFINISWTVSRRSFVALIAIRELPECSQIKLNFSFILKVSVDTNLFNWNVYWTKKKNKKKKPTIVILKFENLSKRKMIKGNLVNSSAQFFRKKRIFLERNDS